LIEKTLQKKEWFEFSRLAGIDLAEHFRSFKTLAIVVAGLIDGINPCAFTVIVFFVSFLAFQGMQGGVGMYWISIYSGGFPYLYSRGFGDF